MLLWKIKIIPYAYFDEDVVVLVKAIKCFFSSFEEFVIMKVAMNIVAEIKESTYTTDHINWNKSFDSGQENFHQGLQIIPSPLFEPSSLRKATKA